MESGETCRLSWREQRQNPNPLPPLPSAAPSQHHSFPRGLLTPSSAPSLPQTPLLHPQPESHLSPLLPNPPPPIPTSWVSIPFQRARLITASKPAQQVPVDPALPERQVRRRSSEPPAAGCLKTPIISAVRWPAQPAQQALGGKEVESRGWRPGDARPCSPGTHQPRMPPLLRADGLMDSAINVILP